MHPPVIRSLRTLGRIALAALCACAWTAHADLFAEGDHVMLQFGPYVYHRTDNPDHDSTPLLVGAEWESASRWEIGGCYFENSFHQPSVYIYGGRRWFLRSGDEGFYGKITGGLLYGYKEPHEDAIPVNYNGVGPVIIPAIGYQYQRANAQLVFLGTNGLMLTFGYDFWK
ncbi:MAG: hypothetical protein ACT4PQ_00030 [Betaproteobacteria bacterium]